MSETASIHVQVKNNHFNSIADKLEAVALVALDRAVADWEQQAKAEAPFKSGALRSSGYRVTTLTSTYATAVAAMRSINGSLEPTPPPELERSKLKAAVGFAAPYALPVHDGHTTRSGGFVAGRPWLSQSFAAHRGAILKAVQEAIHIAARVGV